VFVICACVTSSCRSLKRRASWATSIAMEGRDGSAKKKRAFAEEAVGRQLAPLWPSSFRATTWHSQLQNHALRHRPQSSSLSPFLPHAWHAFAAGASNAESTADAVVLGPAASGTRGATSAPTAVIVRAPPAGRQLTPEWPCRAARTWHSRLQNHTPRHRPQRSSLSLLLPHAWHELAAGASDAESTHGAMVLGPAASGTRGTTLATALGACPPSGGRQLAPEWPCLAARTWHSRLQNHTPRHRPQRSSLASLLPHAWHAVGAIAEAKGKAERVFGAPLGSVNSLKKYRLVFFFFFFFFF